VLFAAHMVHGQAAQLTCYTCEPIHGAGHEITFYIVKCKEINLGCTEMTTGEAVNKDALRATYHGIYCHAALVFMPV
jgi:hypothetical protein